MVEPMNSRVLVEGIKDEYHGILEIPPNSKEKPTLKSRIVAISNNVNNPKSAQCVNLPIEVGDIIYHGEWAGLIVRIEDKNYRIMPVADIVGKLVKTKQAV